MRRALIGLLGLLAALVALFLYLRGGHGAVSAASAVAQQDTEVPNRQVRSHRNATKDSSKVLLNRELLEDERLGAERDKLGPWSVKWRNYYYERLLVKQGRDQVKEEQLFSKVMNVFGEKPDASVREIACSADFCRCELAGMGGADVINKYGRELFSALDARELPRFYTFDYDDAGNMVASLYFGRDRSWQANGPIDFEKLGLIPKGMNPE
jgi:hypothetical protein